MNRRDFLKLTEFLPLLFGKRPPLQAETFDIVSAFQNATDGSVINLPSGLHLPTESLSLKDKKRVIVNGNNTYIYPYADFGNRPVLDLSGSEMCKVNDLWIQSPQSANTLSAVAIGRTSRGNGNNNVLSGLQLEGSYTGATIYSVCAEVNHWKDCLLQSSTDRPVVINTHKDYLGLGLVESSNCVHWMQNCTIYNGTGPYAILHKGMVEDAVYQDCFMYLHNGHGFRFESIGENDYTHMLTLSDIRTEGIGNCLLIDNAANWAAGWDISRISHMITSDYIIHSSCDITSSCFDGTFFERGYASKWIHMTNGSQLRGVNLVGNWIDRVE